MPIKLPVHTRLYVKRTPWLYRLAKHLTDKRAKALLCGRNSDLCIEGYQSSGNSFSFALLRVANVKLRIAHHCHSFANLQMALDYGVPAVCLVRHPEDAISSRVARFNSDLEDSILEYIDFYELAQKQLDRLIVVTFEVLTKNTEQFLRQMAEATGKPFPLDDIDGLRVRACREMREWSEQAGLAELISLPYSPREEMKMRIRDQIRNAPQYAHACAIWNAVAKKGARWG